MTITAVLIRPTGDTEIVELRTAHYGDDGEDADLKHMYELLECTCITAIGIPDGFVSDAIGWGDDEALLTSNPQHNLPASLICRQNLYGNILITGRRGPTTVSVNAETLEFFAGDVGETDD